MTSSLFSLLFIFCNTPNNNLTAQNIDSKIVKQHLDTFYTKPYIVTAKPDIFETAFFNGTEVTVDTFILKLLSFNIGDIYNETGKIVACDPVMTYQQEPFVTQFPIGHFPVQLCVANVANNEFVAFSRILFSNEPVKNWEFALKEKQEPISIFGDSMYFYPVDGGLGQFIDESSFNKLEKLDEASRSQIMNNLFAELDKNSRPSWQYANTKFKDINIIAFTSGFGDGRYSTYIGFDKDDRPCRLLTDFGLVNWLKR